MKNYSIIGFVFGVGAGCTAGFYFGKKISEKKASEEVEFKIAQIRAYYDDKLLATKNELMKARIAEDDKEARESSEGTDTIEDKTAENEVIEAVVKTNEEIVQKCNYSAFSKKSGEEEDSESHIHPVLEPNEISEREFYDYEDEGYRAITATYCAGDDTWFDEDDVPMGDMKSRVGAENMELFITDLESQGGDDERWVRNEMCNEVFHLYIVDLTSEEYMKGR